MNKIQKVEFPTDYKPFLEDILAKIQSTRYEMLMSVGKQTLLLYWSIVSAVNAKMLSAGWGKSVVEKLAKDLQAEIHGVRGFSARNIWRMKIFAEFYYATFGISAAMVTDIEIPQISATIVAELETDVNKPTRIVTNSATAVAELQMNIFELITNVGWVQNCIILEKCKDLKQIVFYLKQTKEKGWSKLDLLEKIGQNYFENFALAQNNSETTVPETLKAQVAWEFLDDYNIELDEKEYFVDLLFFNITLNCYVVFELKARDFSPKDVGQTQMYMQLINKQVKLAHHNNTIGIILCRAKNRIEVEYMLELAKDPMGVATYNRYSQLPEEYAKYLPSEEELDKRLSEFILKI